MEFNALQKDILEYITQSDTDNWCRRSCTHKLCGRARVFCDLLYDEFVERRTILRRQLVEAAFYLEAQGYIWWDNGHWTLTKKGDLYCGVQLDDMLSCIPKDDDNLD
jgi:hypothetical protein